MAPIHTSVQDRAEAKAKAAWEAERQGAYERGLLCFSDGWAEPGFEPDTVDLPDPLAAEIRLRFASLLGFQGHLRKIKDSQRRACDILTSTLAVFERLGIEEKCAECENHIALTYSRTGEYAESHVWLDTAMTRDLPATNIHRLATVMYRMLIALNEQKFAAILEIYEDHEARFRRWADDWIGSSFYTNAGVALGETGSPDDSIMCFELAAERAQRSSNKPHLATIQNELAHVYMSVGRFERAHLYVDKGIDIYREIGDESREGMLFDTKAAILLVQGNFEEALTTIETAIHILKDGENKAFLAEAYATKAKILVWLDDFGAGIVALFEASKLAETYSGREFAKTLIAQFEAELEKKNDGRGPGENRSNGLEDGSLELVLPPSLASHASYRGIRINNDHLLCVGVQSGSLVIAVESSEIRRGDLVAVAENHSGEISCGFYDLDFGVLCVETCESEPRLFDPGEVTIVGKIVGIAGEPDQNGLRSVVPIRERLVTS
ncbi:MAG: tetratricopeptide repeat protein [Pyrinomonadaceae bacterium]